MREVRFGGLSAIELAHRGVRMTIVHAVGPRIAWFGRRENLLFWDDAERGRGAWRLHGGHRLWVTRPGADESEETYVADDRACQIRRLVDGAAVVAPPDASRIEKSIVVHARDGVWTIAHRLRNVGDMLWSGGAWALTCTLPRATTRYRVPLGGGDPAWDVLTMVIPRRWGGGHTSALADRQFAISEDAVEIRARGSEAKRMFDTPRGMLEMVDTRAGTFRKCATRIDGAAYPYATNVAVYLAPKRFMVELETMSPTRTLAPGAMLSHIERWTLT